MGRPKKSTTAAAGRGQNTLSFAGKVTKPAAATSSKVGKSADQKPFRRPSVSSVTSDSRPSTPAAEPEPVTKPAADHKLALRQQAPAAPQKASEPLSQQQEEALKLSDARVKKYWKEKEDGRIAPRGMRFSHAARLTSSSTVVASECTF